MADPLHVSVNKRFSHGLQFIAAYTWANKSGSTAKRINDYFTTSCFPPAPVIGADGLATAFGNAPTGNSKGPSEFVSDTSLPRPSPIK